MFKIDKEILKKRFENKFILVPNSTCWFWIAAQDHMGRGMFNVGKQKTERAHRVSYALYVGGITDDLCVCHKCDNPNCVNPEHLFLGTHNDNMKDMSNKKRSKFNKVKFLGKSHPQSKITEKQVLEIRERYKKGNGKKLADEYGISLSHLINIVKKICWKHLNDFRPLEQKN